MMARFVLAGSAQSSRRDARIVGAPNPAEIVEVTVVLRRRAASMKTPSDRL